MILDDCSTILIRSLNTRSFLHGLSNDWLSPDCELQDCNHYNVRSFIFMEGTIITVQEQRSFPQIPQTLPWTPKRDRQDHCKVRSLNFMQVAMIEKRAHQMANFCNKSRLCARFLYHVNPHQLCYRCLLNGRKYSTLL